MEFKAGDYVIGTDPLTLKEWKGKIVDRTDGKQVVLNESKTWKYVTDLYGLKLLDETDMSQQPINSFNDYVNNKIGNAIDNGSNFEKIKPEDMKKLSKSFFDATKKNHEIKDHPSTEDEAEKITQNAIATKTLEKQNGDDVAAKEAEKNISEIEAKLKENFIKELSPSAKKLIEVDTTKIPLSVLNKEMTLREFLWDKRFNPQYQRDFIDWCFEEYNIPDLDVTKAYCEWLSKYDNFLEVFQG